MSRLRITAGLLVASALLVAFAAHPGAAAAQTSCVPGEGDTYAPGSGEEPPPGGVIVGPGESCPETEPVAVTPTALPPPPKCDPSPQKQGGTKYRSSGNTASTPVSNPIRPIERLPFTGLDSITWGLLLGGLGLVAIGVGFGLRRLASRT